MNRLWWLPLCLVLSSCATGLKLEVLNESEDSIYDFQVNYNGLPISVDKIDNNQKVDLKLNPTGESDINLSYRFGESEQRVECPLNVYVEPGFKGKINVKIARDKCYVVNSDIATF